MGRSSIRFPLGRPRFGAEELEGVRGALESGWVSQGPRAAELERRLGERFGFGESIAVSNCTAALHLANLLIGTGPGDEVAVSDFTFPATGHAVAYTGARPVFVDVDPGTYNMDPEALEAAITPRTKAVVVVHAFGQCADMPAITRIAAEHDLPVVEDAACALGASIAGKAAGLWGDRACFSFHARKSLTTGEGGLLVLNGDAVKEAATARALATFGARPTYEREASGDLSPPRFTMLGYNYKLSDIQAAVGLAQLDRFDGLLSSRRATAALYRTHLDGMDGVTLPVTAAGAEHAYQSFVVVLDDAIDRDQVIHHLAGQGIQTQLGTYASHRQPVYGSTDVCPNSARLQDQSLALPLYVGLEDADVAAIAEGLKSAIQGCRR